MDHFARLARMYSRAACNAHVQPRIAVGPGSAVVRFAVRPDFFHPAGTLHGSYYFKALDDAAFFAANSLVEDVYVLTVSFSLQLLRPVSSGELTAEGRVIRAGRELIFAGSVARDDAGRELATGHGVFARSGLRLADAPGYADD